MSCLLPEQCQVGLPREIPEPLKRNYDKTSCDEKDLQNPTAVSSAKINLNQPDKHPHHSFLPGVTAHYKEQH
jgi:hypothetical protein